jgi:hypothetical protein
MNCIKEIHEVTLVERLQENVKLLETKTGLSRSTLFKIFSISMICLIIGIYDSIVSTLIGIVFPIKWTIEAKDNKSIKNWLSYWFFYSIFCLVEIFAYVIIQVVPFYYLLKSLILITLFLPNFKGAIILYDYLQPKLKKLMRIHNTRLTLKEEIEKKLNK